MNWGLAFIIAIPAGVAVLIIWMIAAGYGKTDGLRMYDTPNPYPERFDAIARWVVGIATAALYVFVAATLGFRAAAITFAVILLVNAAGALIWTTSQEVVARIKSDKERSVAVPFHTRLFRNFRDFYANLILFFSYGF